MLLLLTYAAAAVFIAGNLYRALRVARLPAHLRWELYPMPKGSPAQQRYGGSYFELPERSANSCPSCEPSCPSCEPSSTPENQPQLWTALAAEARDLFPWSPDQPAETSHRAHEHTNTRAHDSAAEAIYIAREVFFFATVFRRNRPLWFWSWTMHLGLYALVLTTVFALLGTPLTAIRSAASISAVLGIGGTAGLLAQRSFRLRPSTSRADLFNLLFIVALFLTTAAVAADPLASSQLATFAKGLRSVTSIHLGALASAHLLLLSAFVIYFPATHMTHAYMKFFAFHRVRWDDTPLSLDPATERAMAKNLLRPIRWSAPHIAGSGSTWAAATQGPQEKR